MFSRVCRLGSSGTWPFRGFSVRRKGWLAAQNTEHTALVTGPAAEPLLEQVAQSCDRVIVIDDAGEVADQPESWLQLLTAICTDRQPTIVLLGDDTRSQELAPRLAHRLSGSSVGDALSIDAVE